MPEPPRALVNLALAILAAASLAACSNTKTTSNASTKTTSSSGETSSTTPVPSSSPATVIARVGATPITTAQVSHWMTALAGEDYYTANHQILPEGLVSDPPNYPACVAHLETAAASSPAATNETPTQLLNKCHEINEAVKLQAITFLINSQINLKAAHEAGITTTTQEVTRLYNQIKANEYPTQASLNQYLTTRHTTIPNIQLETQLETLGNNILTKTTPQQKHQFLQNQQHWTTKTTCQTGYIVEHCNQYTTKPTPKTPLSAAILMEQLTHTTH
jgi:hypothetical protein